MTDRSLAKPNATTYSLEDIVAEVWAGRVRIPNFQRRFRWQWDDVRRLFDSIVRGYPVGSLLLWERPAMAETIQLGSLKINAPKLDEALWVVDGQQRLTSLASALSEASNGDSRFAIAYDLANDRFTKATDLSPHVIPLPVVFDLQELLRWFATHPMSSDYFHKATGVAKAIRQYALPAYIVKHQDEKTLRDIFDRMNNYGKRLTRAEVFSALHTQGREEDSPQRFLDIAEYVNGNYGFGLIDENTLLLAFLARRGHDITREIRIEFDTNRLSREFPNESPSEAYRGTQQALSHAVEFLQQDAGVPHFSFLPYRYLLVVLTRFFAHFPKPHPRNRELLRRWYWRAALLGPEGFGGWTQALGRLNRQIGSGNESQSVQSLLEAIRGFELKPFKLNKFRSPDARSRIFLCALWSFRPRSLLTGEPYDQTLLASALEDKPTASSIVYPLLRKQSDDSMANRCILLGDDLIESFRNALVPQQLLLFDMLSNDLMEGLSGSLDLQQPHLDSMDWPAIFESHGLNAELVELMGKGQTREFLDKRKELLRQRTNQFLDRMTAKGFEDTPPLEDLDLDAL